MIKILLADDHALYREGLRSIILKSNDIELVAEAATGREAIELVQKYNLDALLLDISLPDINGLEVLEHIHCMMPELPVLIVSMYPEEQYAIRLLKIGASGYITKENCCEELFRAIRKVARGGKYVSPNVAELMATELADDFNIEPHEKLSNREFQVLRMMANGKSISEIANELSLSVKTISTNRTRILRKMHMHNNAELISYAIHNHLVV